MSAEGEYAREEMENIGKTLSLMEELLSQAALGRHELTALGSYVNNAYSGVERLLRSKLENAGVRVAPSEHWHKELLQRALADGLVTAEQFNDLLELLGFRHFHTHGYGHMLKEDRLRELAVVTFRVIPAYLEKPRDDINALAKFVKNRLVAQAPGTSSMVDITTDLAGAEPILSGRLSHFEFEFMGRRYHFTDGAEMLVTALREIESEYPGFLERFDRCGTRTRKFVAKSQRDLYRNKDQHFCEKHSKKINDQWWVSTNWSNPQKIEILRKACNTAGLVFGKDLILPLA